VDFITYQLMIPFLQFVVQKTQSYGLAIIMLTLAVRALVWPLVSKSTKNMQKMGKLSPMLKELQERYKDDQEMLQRKMMEFWSVNKVNPMSGCWPMLVQLPILLALFGTFNGPPFSDKPIDVPVKVIEAKESAKREHKEVSGSNCPYVSKDGKVAKLVVFPGESKAVEGDKVDFSTRVVEGEVPADFKVKWQVQKGATLAKADEATIDQEGHAVFLKPGDYKVEAVVEGVAKNDSFLFINSLGKKATGLELLKPENLDLVAMIALFGLTMFLSSKLTMTTPKDPSQMDEQQRVQADTAKMMPLVMTATFVIIPLPAGVYLYMLVSSLVQTLQTWLIMRKPAPDLIDVDANGKNAPTGLNNPNNQRNPKVIDIGTAPSSQNSGKNGKNGVSSDEGATIQFDPDKLAKEGETVEKGKSKKKKKK
jgi:YidC/Oxa1 family membrane protein insertase